MRYLWIVTIAMFAIGALLIAGKAAGLLSTIALLAGLLFIWSAVVKVMVLRIWRLTFHGAPLSELEARGMRSGSLDRQLR